MKTKIKKSLLCSMLALMFAVCTVSVDVFSAKADENAPSAPESVVDVGSATELTPNDFAEEENLLASTQGLLDTYGAIQEFATRQPFPSDWGIKVGEIESGVFAGVNNSMQLQANSGVFVASYLSTSKNISALTTYYVESEIKPIWRGDWGGVGIVIGKSVADDATKDAPIVAWVSEGGNVTVTHSFNEWACAVGNTESVATIDVTMKLGAVVVDKMVSVYLNDEKVGKVDLTSLNFVPMVGVGLKNWNAQFSNVAIKTFGAEEQLSPADFADATNLSVGTKGLFDTYGAIQEFATQQPFPGDWGIKVAEVQSGVFSGVNNSMVQQANPGAFVAAYLPTSKDVSNVATYYVEADIMPIWRGDWGGLGIVVGRSTADDATNGSPIIAWVSEGGNVTVTHSFNEWACSIGVTEDIAAVDVAMKLGVLVENKMVSIYLNGVKLGGADLSALTFVPTLGVALKNWNAEFSNVTFKTNETVETAAKYTITQISGGVEVGSLEYTYGEEVTIAPVERQGWKFMGWHLLPDLSDAVIEKLPSMTGGNVTVYCEYIVENYTITYYDGTTELTDENLTKTYTYRDYVSLEAVEKEGYTFDGWYETADFSGEKVEAIPMKSEGDKVFYAKYTKIADETNTSSGCEGSIALSSAAMGTLALAGLALLLNKKKAD